MRAGSITVTTAGPSPELPPPTAATPDPRLLSFEADLCLQHGNRKRTEFLSWKAEALREAAQ
jgi:hypothetical protein